MADEIAVPDPARTAGPLPFSEVANLMGQGSTPILDCSSSPAWPAGSTATRVGQAYDHTAELEATTQVIAEVVGKSNRKLRIAGVTYSIVDYELNEFVPHLAVRLKVVRGG